MSRNFAIVCVLIALVALSVTPAFAQDSQPTYTVTFTEDEINAWFQVETSTRYRVSDVLVDLQAGQLTLSATITPARAGSPYSAAITYVPELSDDEVFWNVSSVLVNGQPATDKQIAQINAALASSWQRYIKEQIEIVAIHGVTITDTTLSYTISVHPENVDWSDFTPGIITVTEAQINAAYGAVLIPRPYYEDAFVDVQESQATIYLTLLTLRKDASYHVTLVVAPAIQDGAVLWNVLSITTDNTALPADTLAQINETIATSWRQYMRVVSDRYLVTGVAVGGDAITFSYERNPQN